jgi:hypothetical protein
MIRGLIGGVVAPELRVLTARETSEATRLLAVRVFAGLGARVAAEHDPDLPMLLKNMGASRS